MNATHMPRHYRTIWLSDMHLGAKSSQTDKLLAFLNGVQCETLYLVGDIVDGWKLGRGWRWTETQTEIVQDILHRARSGIRVVLVPGNHDPMFRHFSGLAFCGLEIRNEVVHETADGRRMWVLHGDDHDGLGHHPRCLSLMADAAYQATVSLNRFINAFRKRMGKPYWSLPTYVKTHFPKSARFIQRFEETISAEAAKRGYDGVVCGHIHVATMKTINGIQYCNDGDWVESCTCLVEHSDGRLELVEAGAASMVAAPRYVMVS